jgi:hypothetical protein
MYFSPLNRFLITVVVFGLLLQSCRSSLQVTSEEPVSKKLRKTGDDESTPNRVSVPDVLSSVVSDVPYSRLPTVASATSPPVATSTGQVTSLMHHLAVGPDTVSGRAQASSTESEETDKKPAARPTVAELSLADRFSASLGTLPLQLSAVFGPQEWSQYFEEVGEVPPLPDNIAEIWHGPCPFWPGEQVRDTHLLVLMPAMVNGAPFSLDLLGELIKHPKGGGHATEYRIYGSDTKKQFGAQSPIRSYWVLMTRDVLEGSRSKKYAYQQALIARHASRTGLPYELPGVLEAATAILSYYVRSGKRLYTDNPWTYTRCRELAVSQYPAVVGEFSPEGLVVGHHDFIVPTRRSGVGALLKFIETDTGPAAGPTSVFGAKEWC